MSSWTAFPLQINPALTGAFVKKHWGRLHAGDCELLPETSALLGAWAKLHSGAFEAAADAGAKLGATGMTVANVATCMYADHIEPQERVRLQLLREVADKTWKMSQAEPDNANTFYWNGYALTRYTQGISVALALAQGMGTRIKHSLETAIRLNPRHAHSHIALGGFHAEMVDKLGALIGAMTFGVSRETGLKHLQLGMQLAPQSTGAQLEYATALLKLDEDQYGTEATRILRQLAATEPLDALERIDIELAIAAAA